MIVRNWMTRKVVSVKPRDSVLRAREVLEVNRIRQVPVVVEGRIVGIVTDRDLRDVFPSVFDAQFHGEHKHTAWSDPEKLTVETVMSSEVISLALDDNLGAAATLMVEERIGAIPVIDDGLLVGILTRTDALRAFISLCEIFDDQRANAS